MMISAVFVLLTFLSSCSGVVLVTPLIKAGEAAKARSLSRIEYKGQSFGYAGHFTVAAQRNPNRSNHIYTWVQPCRSCDAGAPLLIWLQGGPGGPGWFGAFGELGNWFIGGNTTDSEPHERCFSWCITNHCVFVDSPVQTGFSYQTVTKTGEPVVEIDRVDFTDTSAGAMAQVFDVLLQTYTMLPELASAPLVIAGESYGGLYTPNLAYIVQQHNARQLKPHIDFRALVVGDPAIAWKDQMPTYANTLYGMGVIMLDERAELQEQMEDSVASLDVDCTVAFNTWNAVWDDNGGLGPSEGRGWFARKTGSFNTENVLMGNSPVGWQYLDSWWRKPEAKRSFHVDGVPAPSNATAMGIQIYDAFVRSGDWCGNSSWLYARVLSDSPEVDVLIYSSTSDPLLGPPTTEAAVYAILRDAEAYSPSVGAKLAAAFRGSAKQASARAAMRVDGIRPGHAGREFCDLPSCAAAPPVRAN